MADPSLLATAQQIAQAAYAARQQAANQARQATLQGAKAVQAAYGGLAQLQQANVAPTQQTYQAEAGRSEAFGKGYSDAFQHAMQQAQQAESAQLNTVAPGSAAPVDRSGAADALRAMYGATGDTSLSVPNSIRAQGLSQVNLARQAPVTSTGLGVQALQAGTNQASSAYQQALAAAATNKVLDTQRAYSGLQLADQRHQQLEIEKAYKDALIKQGNTRITTTHGDALTNEQLRLAALTHVNPVTNEPLPGWHANPKTGRIVKDAAPPKSSKDIRLPNAALSGKYGYIVDSTGKAILKGGKKQTVAASSAAPPWAK